MMRLTVSTSSLPSTFSSSVNPLTSGISRFLWGTEPLRPWRPIVSIRLTVASAIRGNERSFLPSDQQPKPAAKADHYYGQAHGLLAHALRGPRPEVAAADR